VDEPREEEHVVALVGDARLAALCQQEPTRPETEPEAGNKRWEERIRSRTQGMGGNGSVRCMRLNQY